MLSRCARLPGNKLKRKLRPACGFCDEELPPDFKAVGRFKVHEGCKRQAPLGSIPRRRHPGPSRGPESPGANRLALKESEA